MDPSSKATQYKRVPSNAPEEAEPDEDIDMEASETPPQNGGMLEDQTNPTTVHPFEVNGDLKSMKIVSEGGEDTTSQGACAEVKLFLGLALPTILIECSTLALGTMTTSYVGQHIGRHALTGFAVANLAANLLGHSLIYGMLNGMDSLAPQAMGAGRYAEVGYLAQSSLVLCFLLMFGIMLIYWNAGQILTLLGQPEDSIKLASRFLRVYCLALPADTCYLVIRRFLSCQNIVAFFVVIAVAVVCIHWFYLYLFVTWAGYGFDGAAMAHVASLTTQFILSLLYTVTLAPYNKETWKGFSLAEAFNMKRLKACLKLGIPGILANNEWWHWECVCMLAGDLGELELASHTIAYNVVPLAFMLPLGMAVAVTNRVGNLLAQGKLATAKMVSYFALFGGFVSGIFTFTVAYVAREHIISAFAGNDEEVHAMTEKIWLYVCIFVVADGVQGAYAGIFRGLAAQFYLSAVMFLFLWVIGIPCLYIWSFTYGHGLVGIWQVLMCLYFLLVPFQTVLCYCWIDWTKVVQE